MPTRRAPIVVSAALDRSRPSRRQHSQCALAGVVLQWLTPVSQVAVCIGHKRRFEWGCQIAGSGITSAQEPPYRSVVQEPAG